MLAKYSSSNPDLALTTLEKELWEEDPVFSEWRDAQDDKHWAKKDLSAVRLGYELAKKMYEPRIAKLEGEIVELKTGLDFLDSKLK